MTDEEPADRDDDSDSTPELELDAVYDAIDAVGRPHLTATEFSRKTDLTPDEARAALERLADDGDIERQDVSEVESVWYPTDIAEVTDRERVVLFPDRREVVVEHPDQFTRAQLSQFARLQDTNRSGGYVYELREEDIWAAPHESLDDLLTTMRDVLGERSPHLEEWVTSQWERARKFRLKTHEDGYVVLEAESDDLMGNVARPKLDDDHLRAPISDSESWVNEDATAEIKRTLYEAGYPVRDDRDLETGDAIEMDLRLRLRDYQQDWVERFTEQGSGVFVGPPGSGKTVAAMGAMAAIGGETLILVPSRELATQWRDELVRHTSLTDDDIGEYHGGEKEIRAVTIATYRTAGMDRHRKLFDQRKWGLIVFDEVHHVPSPIHRRSADLQTKHRLGLTATPTRESDDEEEIFTLIGPPIGTDWGKLFDEGYVAEPEVEIRLVPWGDETEQSEYSSTSGHDRRQAAASNTGKIDEIRYALAENPAAKALVFIEYLDQGEAISEAIDAPFISGETPHARREKLFDEFRRGELTTLVVSRVGDEGIDLPDAELALVASGLGGSRRQGAQRAGRTMRPAGDARMVILATRGTTEEDFVRRQMRHLASKGIRVTETEAEAVEPPAKTE
ncbi:DNA excision repair protein ERCC-3 [Haloarcula quadrata]|uniref:Putative DNA 3'-5' helicase Rad25 n=5 Tax=Haloarcula TaxID=2237 RepID=RAD25_HALMA|nr:MULTISPECIES: DEAD/DEAH box helicase family protein [Haloarcula]Q5V5F7.2 RecName: Full=Putative DNA helicase Rad25 [Haloarcula marismortui ATCC 43049]NHN62184.1 DEAD/DEAH box helicase family protein [Haloarcula sp. JP-Z28]NHX38903.1 DEAD/DEAH box helicase family protein [Haloarcula sp. R1-2]EMA13179.1 DNA repair helicase [Haloarcula sinaiiensis ATCC 33800]EMA21926.1 DNA repair helicase [Haloarcula californiae ATCC 33799]QCP93024.1 DEAD/DEAH box helicase [Haloarcula marismortui ATCC 43049]